MKLSMELIKVVKLIFEETQNKNLNLMEITKENKKKSVIRIGKRQEQVENLMLRTTNQRLLEKLEYER